MAFVYQAKRNFNYITSDNPTLGPGAYIGHEEYKQSKAQVPFSSTSVRDFSLPAKPKVDPGPGAYEVATPKKLKIDQFGRYKCSSSFSSNLNRFGAGHSHLNPGPGAYHIEKSWSSNSKPKQQVTKSRILNTFPSVPSIPTQSQAYGYDETLGGELISQKNPNDLHSGTPGDHIGPGHYNPKPIIGPHSAKGTVWHKSNSRRELVPSSSSSNLGPGSYTESRGQNIYKLKTSSSFASACKRDAYIPTRDDYEEFSDDFETQDGNPGPGQYFYNSSSFTSTSKSVVSSQKFGTGSKRFVSSNNDMPGPGYYHTGSRLKVAAGGDKAPFASKDPRFAVKNTITPGPGAYNEPRFLEFAAKKAVEIDGAFGSGEKRFQESFKHDAPGPGHYESDNRVGIHNSAKGKPLAVFTSKVERKLPLNNPENPPPGVYEIPSGFDKREKISAQPVLVRVNAGIDKILGFNSKEDRWKTKNNEMPGPGAYNKIRKTQKKINKKNAYVSKDERFGTKKADQFPGPGTYFERNNPWNKKTFNIQFTELD